MAKKKGKGKPTTEGVVKGINKGFGDNFLIQGDNTPKREYRPTGFLALDKKGIGPVVGGFTVIWGSPSVGKTTFSYHTLAIAQQKGQVCGVIDVDKGFDREWAEKCGVNLDKLAVANIEIIDSLEDSLQGALEMVRSNQFDFILYDSYHNLPSSKQIRKGDKTLKKVEDDDVGTRAKAFSKFVSLARAPLFKSRASLVVICQQRAQIDMLYSGITSGEAHALQHAMVYKLFMRKAARKEGYNPIKEKVDGKTQQVGHYVTIKVDKGPGNEGYETDIPFLNGRGFDAKRATLIYALERNVFGTGGGGYYKWTNKDGEEDQVRGKPDLFDYFLKNEEEYQRLFEMLLDD